MTESMLGRLQRVVSAGVGEALDAAERFTGLGLLRESIRRVEAEIAGSKRRQAAAAAGRAEAAEQQRAYRKEAAGLTDDARFALGKGRPDLAERAIARQIDLEDSVRRAAASEASHAAEEKRLAEEIAELEARHAALSAELSAAMVAKDAGGSVPDITALRREEDIATRLAALQNAAPAKSRRAAKSS